MLQNILATLFSDVLLLLSILILVPVTILFTECILALLPDTNKLQDMYTQVARPIVTVLIPAHNEKEVIEQTDRKSVV